MEQPKFRWRSVCKTCRMPLATSNSGAAVIEAARIHLRELPGHQISVVLVDEDGNETKGGCKR